MLLNSNEYLHTVETIKQEIRTAQYKATVRVNQELLMLYYSIGEIINEHKVWGNKFVENLARDIKIDFPDATGYSVRNLKYMAKFAEAYPSKEFVQQPVAQIPWGHNTVLLDKLSNTAERLWYAEQKYMAKFAEAYPSKEFVQQPVAQIPWGHNTVLLDKLSNTAERLWYAEQISKNGWSRNVLVHQIESGLYQRQVLAEKVSNFENRLPSPQSELAVQTMKDPYIFDFIPFKPDMVERDIEQVLVKDVTKRLLELGTGFAFLGNQYHLNVGGDDFYIDLLFYNLNLRCYVVIELKTGEFKPEYAGQLNFYLSAVDDILKKEQDCPSIGLLLCKSKNDLIELKTGEFKPEYAGQLNFYLSAVDDILKKEQDCPSIGLLLCKSKNDLVAEYSLKDMSKPIGVSAYQITSNLPEELEKQLPSVEDIQKRIQNI